METQPTCGEGLAANAVLPEKLGHLIDAVAEILALHLGTLDLEDENSRIEHAAYAGLVRSHRSIAHELLATAERMAGYRDLPMGRHDEAAFADPGHAEAFDRFVRLESEVHELLQDRLAGDREMLRRMH